MIALVGAPVVALILFAGSLSIGILGYILHRSGFLMATVNETFDQQQKDLYQRQTRYFSARIATCERMSPDELEQELEDATKGLRL